MIFPPRTEEEVERGMSYVDRREAGMISDFSGTELGIVVIQTLTKVYIFCQIFFKGLYHYFANITYFTSTELAAPSITPPFALTLLLASQVGAGRKS